MKTYPRLESLAEMLSPVISEKLLQQIPQEMLETVQEVRIQEGRFPLCFLTESFYSAR